jgi:hypothetical protein
MNPSIQSSAGWSRNARVSLCAGLVAVAALGVGFIAANGSRPAPLKVATVVERASRDSPAPVEAPVVKAALPTPVVQSPAPTTAPTKAINDDVQNARFVPDSASMEASLTRAQEHDELSRRFSSEQQDTKWAAEVEQQMQRLLHEGGISSRALQLVDCRQTICRLKLEAQSDRRASVMAVIHAARALHQETWLLPEEDEQGSTFFVEVFLPRDGYRLSSGGGKVDGELVTGDAEQPEPAAL